MRQLAAQLTGQGHSQSDRNAQFQFISQRTQVQPATNNPVSSVDAKKKELVGDFKNVGRTYRPQGKPEQVHVHVLDI